MEAADESKLTRGGAPVSLESVLAKARAEAAAHRSSAATTLGHAVKKSTRNREKRNVEH